MELWWAEAIRDHCLEAHVPFFFKQVSAFMSGQGEDALGQVYHEFPEVA
jgi:protein gp37